MMLFRTKGIFTIFSNITMALILVLSASAPAGENQYIWLLGDSHVGGNGNKSGRVPKSMQYTYQNAIKYFLESQRHYLLEDFWYPIGTKDGIGYTDYTEAEPTTINRKILHNGYPGAITSTILGKIDNVWDKLHTSHEPNKFVKPDVVMIVTGTNDVNYGSSASDIYNDVYKIIKKINDKSQKYIDIWLVTPMVDAGKSSLKRRNPKFATPREANNPEYSYYGFKMKQMKEKVMEGESGTPALSNVINFFSYNAYVSSAFGMSFQDILTFGYPHEPKSSGLGNQNWHPSGEFAEDPGYYLENYYISDYWVDYGHLIYHDTDCKAEVQKKGGCFLDDWAWDPDMQ